MKATTRFRNRLQQDEILVKPGATDPLAARALDAVGFDAIAFGGYATSISKLGKPDAGFVSLPDLLENARHMVATVDCPVTGDIDTGFGNAINARYAVREMIEAGVASVNLEDQIHPKRCGHVKGKKVISEREAVGKFRAAADVRDELDEDFVLVARTDALGAVDGSVEEAIHRVNSYVDAGADVAFVEGPTTMDEVERIGQAVEAPLLYNCTGVSPKLQPEEAQKLGYDIIGFPSLSMRAVPLSVYAYGKRLKEEGTSAILDLNEAFDEELPFEGFHDFTDFPEIVELEKKYLPPEEQDKYEQTHGADIHENS